LCKRKREIVVLVFNNVVGVEKMLMLIFGTWGKGDLLRNLDVAF